MSNQSLTGRLNSDCIGLTWLAFLCAASLQCFSQQTGAGDERIFHLFSSHTSFPDTARAKGHLYDSVWYDAPHHYSDSSVLFVLPTGFQAHPRIDILFWFHGWNNNIDTALSYYRLAKQFLEAKRNAVLVLAETARNAPDSYGGKLEQPNEFAALLNDLLVYMKSKKLIPAGCSPGNILLAGHSGAYRVIAYIVQNGGVPIQEVDLFDALYGQVDQFKTWILGSRSRRFINWYTNQGGGTDEVSLEMMTELKKSGTDFIHMEEPDINTRQLQANRLIFVHSARPHNDIIFEPDNFRLLLESSPFLQSAKK